MNALRLALAFLKIGTLSFGGGYAGITFIEQEIVKNRRWMVQDEFLHGPALAQLAPGPTMTNLAAFIGYRLRGVLGGTLAILGLLFPSFCLVLLIAALFGKYSASSSLQAILSGVTPAVLGILAAVTAKLAFAYLKKTLPLFLALASFTLIFCLKIHSFYVMLGAVLFAVIFAFRGRRKTC